MRSPRFVEEEGSRRDLSASQSAAFDISFRRRRRVERLGWDIVVGDDVVVLWEEERVAGYVVRCFG